MKNPKRIIAGVIAAFAFIVAFDWGWHGVLMHDSYEATKELWRSQ